MAKPYAVTKSGNSFSVSMTDGKEVRCDPVGYGVWLATIGQGRLTKVGNAYNLVLGNVLYECIPTGYGTWLVIGGEEEETPPPPPPTQTGFKFPYPREQIDFESYYGHSGVDWPKREGTPIPAIGNGTVIQINAYSWAGNSVVIDHGVIDGIQIWSLYAHMNSYPPVSEGQAVTGGATIGYVGNSGQSSGNHLHLEVIFNGQRLPTNTPGQTAVGLGFTRTLNWLDAHASGSWM